ncbi:MAG: hypothetical protein EON54_08100 [Alcaligenaceae bacterium]|nr:MAG: hypothetical protein EON54_08100 [Alcaligenaceae bacterium]
MLSPNSGDAQNSSAAVPTHRVRRHGSGDQAAGNPSLYSGNITPGDGERQRSLEEQVKKMWGHPGSTPVPRQWMTLDRELFHEL